jgi:hypothetical protein
MLWLPLYGANEENVLAMREAELKVTGTLEVIFDLIVDCLYRMEEDGSASIQRTDKALGVGPWHW